MLRRTQVHLCFVIVSIQAALGNLINPCQDDNSPLTNNCFFCICEQASNCDVYKECSGGGFDGGPWCGPLNIGMNFWIQYGNCTLDGDDPKDPLSMERCLTDLACSMKVMRSFANGKNLGDCDGDGRMTCDDYSMAHFLGHIGCSDPDERARYKTEKVYERYTECIPIAMWPHLPNHYNNATQKLRIEVKQVGKFQEEIRI